jgi:hypothetical protein
VRVSWFEWERWRFLIATAVLGIGGLLSWLVFGTYDPAACTAAWRDIPATVDQPAEAGAAYERAVDVCSDAQFREELIAWAERVQEAART